MDDLPTYATDLPPAEVERIRQWHERAYASLRGRDADERVDYLGLQLVVPPEVFPPTPMSDLLGRAVLDEVRAGDRVLDMGTGSGANAILAASRSEDVWAVDINPIAVACARDNAAHNGVGGRVRVLESDLFENLEGAFDLVIFDPPFRWFAPRDLLEAAITDGGYRSLTRFMHEVPVRLRPGGRILLSFGSSGDLAYLLDRVEAAGFVTRVVNRRSLTREDTTVDYYAWRLTRGA